VTQLGVQAMIALPHAIRASPGGSVREAAEAGEIGESRQEKITQRLEKKLKEKKAQRSLSPSDVNPRVRSGLEKLIFRRWVPKSQKTSIVGGNQKSEMQQTPGERQNVNPSEWFKNASMRGSAYLPSDFNLFEIPRYALDKWAQHVSSEPYRLQCVDIAIRDLGLVTQQLFDVIKLQHGLDVPAAVELFDKYLAAACPKCFHGITGNGLQMISACSKMATVVGGGPAFHRILSGRCATCESDHVYVVWHGDRSAMPRGMDEQLRKSIFREHRQLTRTMIGEAAIMGTPERAAIEDSLEKAADQIQRSYGLTFEEFLLIYKEGMEKRWK